MLHTVCLLSEYVDKSYIQYNNYLSTMRAGKTVKKMCVFGHSRHIQAVQTLF